MRWRPRAALLMVLMGPLYARPAAAGPPTAAARAPTAEDIKKADALFQDATRLIDEKKWAAAEAKLLQAQALNPTFDIATNLGQAQARLGKVRLAAENLAFALRNWPILRDMAKRREATKKRLDELRLSIASVTVMVNVPDAAIFVDGERVGISPMKEEIFLDPGDHTIEATVAGYERGTEKIDAAKGSTRTVSLTLKPSQASSGAAAPKAEPLNAAPQDVKQPEVKAQPIRPQPVTPQPIKPEPTPQGSKVPVRTIVIGAGIGTSAALIGTGIGLAVVSTQKGSEADKLADPIREADGLTGCSVPSPNTSKCDEILTLRESRDTYADAAVWTFVAGGAVAAGTLIYTLVTRKKPPGTTLGVVPGVGVGSTVIVVRGRW